MIFDMPLNDYLFSLKKLCHQNGSLLIFDEMWTGFRLALGGAQEYFVVEADLACFSKAIANGMPLSVLTGRQEIMQLLDEEVFFFSTFGGEALSLAAAKATLREMHDLDVPEYLALQGHRLLEGYNNIALDLGILDDTHCKGHPCRTIIVFNGNGLPSSAAKGADPLLMKSLVQQEMIKRGILWSGFHNMCFCHTDEDVDYTLEVYQEVLPILKKAVENGTLAEQIRGEPVQPVFRKTTD
jgi:glutamate-1-semialdehyde aminotransferase